MTSTKTALEIHALIKYYGFTETLARFITAQAAHETGNFTSAIFKSNNNAFGMKYAGQSTADGEKKGYAYYKSVEDSVIDFARWWTKHRSGQVTLPLFIFSLENYVQFLKNQGYYEAPLSEYLKGCKYFYTLFYNA